MKQKIIYILLTFTSVITYGQVDLYMKPDKSDYNAKDIVNLTIVLQLNGDNLVQQSKIQLPDLSKFNIIGNGSFNQALRDAESNVAVDQYVTRIALEPKQKGKIRIGSVLVTVNNKIYKTEPFDIFVRDIDKKPVAKSTDHDVFLNMEIDDKEIYQDQPTVAVLRVYSKSIDNLRKVRNIHLPDKEDIDVHPISFQKSEIDPEGYGNMPSQILAMFIVFPNESGLVEVPSVSASVNSYSYKNKIVSNKVKLNVKKLPEGSPESFKNAVGKFKIEIYHKAKEKIEAKKPVNVFLKVSGEGNLSNMELPKIESSPDYEIFAPKITTQIKAGTGGLKGYVLANYVLIPNRSGNLTINTQEFAFFNPDEKEYVNLGQESLRLRAFSHDQVLESRSTVEKVNEYTNTLLETVNSPVLKTTTFKVKEKSRFNWKALFVNLGILLGLFFIYLLFKNWQKKQIIHKEQNPPKDLGSVAETEREIRESLKTDLGDYFTYLENLKDSQNFDQFFKTVEELDSEIRSQYFQSSKDDFKKFLESYKGNAVAEEYKILSQRIEIEKYTPVKCEEGIGELLKEIINLYAKVSK